MTLSSELLALPRERRGQVLPFAPLVGQTP
jgi:hypothetical protein